MENIIKKKYKIDGMHCTSCAMSIQMDLEDLDGVKKVTISYAKAEAEVEFDPTKANEETILETIKKSGYTATSIVN